MLNPSSLVEVYYWIDEFCLKFVPWWKNQLLQSGACQRQKSCSLTTSEIITIVVMFHVLRFRDFKTYFTQFVSKFWRKEFPGLVSYNRFVELMGLSVVPIYALAKMCCVPCTGTSFVDSTTIKVCHNKRIHHHKVFRESARRGKTSMGWFFGFKLHLVINESGGMVDFLLTPGNVADVSEKVMTKITMKLFGKLFGDKGYLSRKIFRLLFSKGIELITKIKSNMKNVLMSVTDKLLLRRRAVIESVNDQLKNIFQIEHTRHRSKTNFLVNLFSGLIAYAFSPKKPSLRRVDRLILVDVMSN